jgi:transcriptional regulator with XRE-family HTH domain
MRAYLVPTSGPEKRSSIRKTLRLLAAGRHSGRKTEEIVIRDLSAAGMLMESEMPFEVGDKITVEFPRHGASEAAIVWGSGHFYGCRFAEPLPASTISAALLKSEPQTPASLMDEERPIDGSASFGEKLTALREARELTIEQLAQRLPVSRQALWYWETGKRKPRQAFLKRLAEELEVGPESLEPSESASRPASLVQHFRERLAAECGVDVDKVKVIVEF